MARVIVGTAISNKNSYMTLHELLYVHVQGYIHTLHAHNYMCTCAYMYIQLLSYMYMYLCMYMYMYIHVHTCTWKEPHGNTGKQPTTHAQTMYSTNTCMQLHTRTLEAHP